MKKSYKEIVQEAYKYPNGIKDYEALSPDEFYERYKNWITSDIKKLKMFLSSSNPPKKELKK